MGVGGVCQGAIRGRRPAVTLTIDIAIREGKVKRVLPRGKSGRVIAISRRWRIHAAVVLLPLLVPGTGAISDIAVVAIGRLAHPKIGGRNIIMAKTKALARLDYRGSALNSANYRLNGSSGSAVYSMDYGDEGGDWNGLLADMGWRISPGREAHAVN